MDKTFYFETLENGWCIGRFSALTALGIGHAVTTRQGPDVTDARDRLQVVAQQVTRALGFSHSAFLTQVHKGTVLAADRTGCVGEADGLFCTTPGWALVGKSADCPLVLIADRARSIAGFAHASWRSTVAGITGRLVHAMARAAGCDPGEFIAGICPSAGPECYAVGPEVREAAVRSIGPHAAGFFENHNSRLHFNLWQANRDALICSGMNPENIHCAGLCTLCRNDLFPSYRVEGAEAGRFLAAVGVPVR